MADVRLDLIDDSYWLSRARALLDNAITSREEAAGKLVSGVGWFWTVYSTVAIVGTAVAELKLPWWAAVILALPAVFLVMAYLLALRVMLPYNGSFDPNSPDEIEDVYQTMIDAKSRRLRHAVLAVAAAAIAVVAAVMTASLVAPTSSASGS